MTLMEMLRFFGRWRLETLWTIKCFFIYLKKIDMKMSIAFSLFLLFFEGVFGDTDEVKTVSVLERDSVTLYTDLTDEQRSDVLVWTFGPEEARIADIYKKNIDINDSNRRFGDRLKLNSQTGSLTITNIRITDSGLYKLQSNTNRGTPYKIFSVTVYGSTGQMDETQLPTSDSLTTHMPEVKTSDSLEIQRKCLGEMFHSGGPRSAELSDTLMRETCIHQPHMINSCPPPTISEMRLQCPHLFTKTGLWKHFESLTGIDIRRRLSKSLIRKSSGIVNFFRKRKLRWNAEIQALLNEIQITKPTKYMTVISAILLRLKYRNVNESSLFILVNETPTKMFIENELNLPASPRIIMFGETLLTSSKWMISIEGNITLGVDEQLDLVESLSVLCGCFCVFNIEEQESDGTALKIIRRFLGINPKEMKCARKAGTSRKTRSAVKSLPVATDWQGTKAPVKP